MNDIQLMELALKEAEKAYNNGDFPVGCIIADKKGLVVSGLRSLTTVNENDHAEIEALKKLSCLPYDVDKETLTLYSTLEPCLMCYSAIILCKIPRIVYALEDPMGGGTKCDLNTLPPLYRNSTMEIVSGILRTESLDFFKNFFNDPDNEYWKESILSKYVLAAR